MKEIKEGRERRGQAVSPHQQNLPLRTPHFLSRKVAPSDSKSLDFASLSVIVAVCLKSTPLVPLHVYDKTVLPFGERRAHAVTPKSQAAIKVKLL